MIEAASHSATHQAEGEYASEQLYSPAMLAELLRVSVRAVRRWHRAGLITPRKTVLQLPYFGYAEIATAKRLAQWMKQGVTIQSIQHQLSLIRQRVGEQAPLESLPIMAEGKRLVLRQGEVVIEATGQMHFGFVAERDLAADRPATLKFEPVNRKHAAHANLPATPSGLEDMINQALSAEDADDFEAAIDWYRAALAAHGPNPDVCFQLAELLYRQGDLHAARERYFMALELEPNLVEAQANLGCVLAECGQLDLAIAAFEGTLQQFADYADVHFHLARVLDDAGQTARAADHWQRFLDLAPASPWAEEAIQRLQQSDSSLLDL